MSDRISTIFIFLCLPLLVSTLHAGSVLSINQACTKPIIVNSKIFSICNDLNYTDRTMDHPVFLTEINQQLEVINNTNLSITDSDIGRLVKRDSKNAYLLGETKSKCVQVFNINLNNKNTTSLLEYCDDGKLSLPFEVTSQSLILNNQSLVFPLYSKESNITTIKIIQIDDKKETKTLHIKEFENFNVVYFVRFDNHNVLLLRSKKDPLVAVVLAILEDTTGNLQYTKLYETSTFLIMTISNVNNRIFITGNEFNQQQMSFSLIEVFTKGTSRKLIDKWPIPLHPTLLLANSKLMKLYGVVVDANMQALAVSSFNVNSTRTTPLKVSYSHKLNTLKYPLALIHDHGIDYLLTDNKASLLSNTKKTELNYSSISGVLYPSIFYINSQKYLFYIVNDNGQFRSIFEEL